MPEGKSKRGLFFLIFASAIVTLAPASYFIWNEWFRFEEYTDDAYVHGNVIDVNAQMSSSITAIYTDDTKSVQEGDLLIELSYIDARNNFDKAKAQLADTVRRVSKMFRDVETLRAEIEVASTKLQRAKIDLDNRAPLAKIKAIPYEEFQHSELYYTEATKELLVKQLQLTAAETLVFGTTVQTHPLVLESGQKVKESYLTFVRTKIYAPSSGIVCKRVAQIGEIAQVGKPLLSIVPISQVWIEANFKETQLKHLRIGQLATVYADIYGTKTPFRGTVIGLSPGTGNVFSLLPPQNATGNWIKIVQRVPVRIALDPQEIAKHPLLLGMSLRVYVDTHDRSGDLLALIPPSSKLVSNGMYDKQDAGVDSIITSIIQENANKADTF